MSERIHVLYRCGRITDPHRSLDGPQCGKPATHVCHYGPWTFAACDEHPCTKHEPKDQA